MNKVREEGMLAILICPYWPSSQWWQTVQDLLIQPPLPLLQYKVCTQAVGRGSSPGPSGPPAGTSHFRQGLEKVHVDSGLDSSDIEFLLHHLSSGSSSGYGHACSPLSGV